MTNEVQTEKNTNGEEARERERGRDESEKTKTNAYKIYAMSFLLDDRQPYRRHFIAGV